jgi:hypothetical protein
MPILLGTSDTGRTDTSLPSIFLTTRGFTILVAIPPIVPKGDALRRAVAWLAEQGSWTPDLVDQVSQRFDLSPTEEEFLLQECRRFHQQPIRPARDR